MRIRARDILNIIVFAAGITIGFILARKFFLAITWPMVLHKEAYSNLNLQYAGSRGLAADPSGGYDILDACGNIITDAETAEQPIRYSSSPNDDIQYHDDAETIKNRMDGGVPFGTSFTRDQSGNMVMSSAGSYNLMAPPVYYDIEKHPRGFQSFVPNYQSSLFLARASETHPPDYIKMLRRERAIMVRKEKEKEEMYQARGGRSMNVEV